MKSLKNYMVTEMAAPKALSLSSGPNKEYYDNLLKQLGESKLFIAYTTPSEVKAFRKGKVLFDQKAGTDDSFKVYALGDSKIAITDDGYEVYMGPEALKHWK